MVSRARVTSRAHLGLALGLVRGARGGSAGRHVDVRGESLNPVVVDRPRAPVSTGGSDRGETRARGRRRRRRPRGCVAPLESRGDGVDERTARRRVAPRRGGLRLVFICDH